MESILVHVLALVVGLACGVAGAGLGFFGVFYVCSFAATKLGMKELGRIGWVFTFFTVPAGAGAGLIGGYFLTVERLL